MNQNTLFQAVLDVQKEYLGEQITQDIPIKTDETLLQAYADNENSLKIIFDHVNYRILKVSDNMEQLFGYSTQDFLEHNMFLFFKSLTWEHLTFPLVAARWGFNVHKKQHKGNNLLEKSSFCGIKMKHKNGRVIRILAHLSILTTTEMGVPQISVILLMTLPI